MSKLETTSLGGMKLPVVTGGRSSLVASPILLKSNILQPREIAANWANELRTRINENVECHEDVNEDDIMNLKKELIAVFISTLQTNSREQWSVFVEILALLEPYKEYFDYFETKAEFHHYLERVLHHVQLHKSKLFDLQVETYLTRVFPEHIKHLRVKGITPAKGYGTVPTPVVTIGQPSTNRQLETPSPMKSHKYPSSFLPDGTNPYSLLIPSEEEIIGAKGLTLRDINKSMGAVALEMTARESVWKQSLGTTALALAADIPVEEKIESRSDQVSETMNKVLLTPRKKTTPRPVPNMQDVVLDMNGREAVQFFAASYHMGKVKSIYLNLAPNRHYRPYDLISVPKSKINPEHYLFTTFGAVHIYPDQPSDSLTLAEWQRDAVLWAAISKIPFFKNYLINKMFYRWRKNCKLIDFQRKQNMIRTNLLSATPSYGAALLQISKLLKELLTVPFMPTETDQTYQLAAFENNINYKNIQAEKFLSKFFKYCKLIIDFTSDEAFKKIQYCEEQLKKKALFSKDSLSMQRLKKEDREKNLANAQQEASFLGNFVKLVDQLIVEHMFEITKTQSISFVNNVLVMSPDAQREGFFKANLIFGKDAELVLNPSKKRFKKALDSTFKNISTVLMSKSIDFDIWSHEKDPLEGELSSRSDGFKQSEKLSTPTHTDRQSEAASNRSASRRSLTSGSNKTAAESRNPARLSLGNSSTMSSSVDLSFPNLSQKAFPSKEEDELGVATPDLIIMHPEDNDIKVEGQGFLGQYEPLTKANLEEKLLLDLEYQQVLNKQRDLMLVALQDVDSYCEKHQWLNEIHKFCSVWSKKSLEEFKSAAAFNIEQKLTELRQWSERVKSFDVSYVTENGLFYIDCSAIHEGLLPRLNDIYQEIVSFVADEVNCLAQNLIQEMSQILKNMSNKKSEVLLFANLAKNFHIYKKNTLVYQQRVEYIKSLYEVIRMSYRQLTSEEEKTEEKVFSSWEAFQMQMQETSEFVNTQTPLQLSQLEAAFQRLQKETTTQYELATTGKFLDPHQNPVMILADMKMIREKFFALQSKIHEVSHCREAITGEPYNLRFLQDMISKMDLRQELWKYVEVTTHTIKDWNQTLFKKMNFKKALEKISVWQSAATRLTSLLPRGDQVLEAWIKQVEEFSKHLPVLCQLSHDALQERHWQTIFLGMNVPYDPNAQLTVADLLSFNLADHADLINRVYLSALTENNVTSRLDTIISFWQERHFKLAKYLPDSLYNKEQPKRSTSSNARIKKLERYRQERAAAQTGSQRGLDVSSDDFYVLIEVEELKYHLEDSRITLDSMLASPHVNDVKSQVEFLCQALREIEEITDLWFDCQKKWQYLVKIFEQPILYQTLSEHAFKFESVHNKFKDWMRVSSSDSKCMSVINRRRGEKGYRLLQGDNLRVLLQSLIKDQEEILKDLGGYIEKCRATFHRLYFLSNDEIFEMLAVSRNPPALLPFVRLCFPHVENLTFTLPTAMGGLNSQLDISLNSDKLEVACITGSLGEELPLYTKVEPGASAPKWLHNINQVLKNTLTIALKACVQARLEEGTKHPVLVLEELAKLSHSHPKPAQEEITHEIKSIFRQWLLRFPAQSVLTAEAILWERIMSRSLDKKDKEELKNQKLLLHAKLDQLTRVLVEFQSVTEMTETDQQRLNLLISSLLTQSIYYRDIMSNLIETNQVTDSAFDWLKILKLRMDIRNVLRAKTVVTEKPPEDSIRSRTVRKNPTNKRKRELCVQEAPKLARTQTTVTNDYQFSTCYAQQLNQVFTYDYEYLGPYNQLVITPLTERVFLSMGQALKSFHCSALIGPNGTGKTETLRELGKLLGRCLFTITCHNTVTLPVMLQYLTGLVQSGCWAVFDDCDRLTKGLMSVVGQQLDYLRTALRALAMTSENQYQIRGNSHFDKKSGIGDKVIRRNSLTTLHPLPKPETEFVPILERQKTVPHGFNEKGLVTYFEDTWVAERDQRRHSIEREIKIQESELYKSNKPPPLFYEHVKASRRRSQPDYSKLTSEPSYVHRMLGNVMFNGKLLQASCNFGCFMTMNATSAASSEIPYSFRILMRPCAIIVPDVEYIVSVHLESNGYEKHSLWAKKLVLLFKQFESQMCRQKKHLTGLHQMKQVLKLAVGSKFKSLSTEKLDGEECNKEELSIVFAVKELMSTAAESESERAVFNNILRQIFPQATGQQTSSTAQEQQLIAAVSEIFDEDGMERNELMLSKIMELYKSLDCTSSVILAGQPGSGKTKLCHTLAKAVNLLNYKMVSNDATKEENRSQSQVSNHHSQNIQSSIINKDGRDLSRFPKVDMVHIFPGSMTPDQLLGSFEDGVWQCGLLSKILKDSYAKWLATMSFVQTFKPQDKKLAKYTAAMPSILKRWIMIDGSLHPLWTEGIKTLLDSEKHLSQGSGETIQLKDLTKIIFETTDLKTAAPSSVAHSVVIYLGPGTTNWSSLYFNWKQTANNRWLLSAEGLKVLDEIISDLFPATIKFLSTHCQSALLTDVGQVCTAANQVTPGISEVSAFLNIFSALLDRTLKREEKDRKRLIDDRSSFSSTSNEDGKTPTRHNSSSLTNTSQIEAVIPNYQEHLKNIFAFAYIWAFGGHLHDRYKETFSNFAHNALYRTPHPIQLPSAGHVFDYYLDEKTSEFANWSCRQQQDRIKNLAGFYVIPEVDRYSYLTEFLMSANIPILLAGAPGVGKTSFVQSMVLSKLPSTEVIMSNGLTSSILQDLILAHVSAIQNKNNPRPGGPSSSLLDQSKHLFFIDDLNMASMIGDYQPPLELMRCLLSTGGMHDRNRKEFLKTKEASFIAATTIPSCPGSGLGKACHLISTRLTRHFVNLTVFSPSEDSLVTLFSKPLQTWLEEFPTFAVEHTYEFSRAMSSALLDLYQTVRDRLLPSPSKPHYIFSLHDLSKVVQGILLLSPRIHLKKGKTLKKNTGKKADEFTSAPMMKVIAQLWCHEVSRNFGDRLINCDDFAWFSQTVETLVVRHFCSPNFKYKQENIIEEKAEEESSFNTDDTTSQQNMTGNTREDNPQDHDTMSVNEGTASSSLKVKEALDAAVKSQSSTKNKPRRSVIYASNHQPAACPSTQVNYKEKDLDLTSQTEDENLNQTDESDSDSSCETSASDDIEISRILNGQCQQTAEQHNRSHKMSTKNQEIPEEEKGLYKRQDSNKKVVSFKAGLLADKKHVLHSEPLLSINEIKGTQSDVTNFIFSKFYLSCHAELVGIQAEKGYTQQSEEKITEALYSCLEKYNKGTSQRLDLVFFSEAVHHAARLSRVLAQPKGHALLLGMSYCTGRATLTRLAAYVAHCKLFEAKTQSHPGHNLQVLRRYIKLSCFHAGVSGKQTVLLVHEDLGEEGLYDIASIMAEGTAPGLYSETEIQDIVGQLLPGGVQTKKVEKIEQVFNKYIKRIKQNLHVIVCLNYKGNNFSTQVNALHNKLQKHPGLLKHCVCIDIFLPWSFKSLAQVAKTWLQDNKSGVAVPWNPQHSNEQLEATANAMAFIHLSSKTAIERQFCHQREPLRIFTPLTFLEFVHLFKTIAAFLVKTERAKGKKYEQALNKINEAFGSIADYRNEVSDLVPQQVSAARQVTDLVAQVESSKQNYIKALEQCKIQEETIYQLQNPLESLRQTAQTEFDKVNPIYQAAVKVLDNLDLNSVEELRSYPSPPDGVKFVMKAVCLLFNKPQTWEGAKALMVNPDFFQELIFYKKDDIPEPIFQEMKKFVNDPSFVPESIAQASSAASSICAWIHAVYAYSTIQRKMKPRMKDLMEAENKFTQAQAQLGQFRVEAQQIKTNLEQYIDQHKEAIKAAKAIEKQIQAVEKKIARASNLMDNMSMQHFLWRSELKKTRKQITCAPGDALLTAACVAYHGPLDDKSRLDLMQNWLELIKQNTLNAQTYEECEPYSITAKLEFLKDSISQHEGNVDSDDQSESGGDANDKNFSLIEQTCPQVKTFKYISAVYDSSKYYRSELKRQGTMESVGPEQEFIEDDDDDDENVILPTRLNLTLQDILSDFDELSEWRMLNLPTDLHSVQNALMMRVCCHNRKHCWPLLIDPDNQAEMWVKVLHKSHNIFTQKDVADFVVDDDIPYDESFFKSEDAEDTSRPPPSRETMLTYNLTESSQYSYSRPNTRGRQSQHTADTEELLPVTSVTNSWDNYNLHPDTEIDLPSSNLWVLEADDPNINSRLINAIVHGVTVLITHLERRPLDPLFRGLLLKQFYVDKDGNKVVRVGDMVFNYHQNFCLYLSTSVPLFVKGDGLYSFPLNRVCVINMAVSDEAIINRLMFETMQVEKKEFEGQRRSNENDIILHRQRLAREHEIIREKTLNLTGPLLDDKTMLDSLLTCQTNVEHNRQILQETRFMGDHLEEKFAHYTPFVKHSVMLYNAIGKMSVLYPCYYLPFYKFVEIFADVIRSRDRGKGSVGAPQMRAQELSDAVTHGVFNYARLMMFQQHYNLLALIVCLERMLRQHKTNNKELSLFVNGCQKLGLNDASLAEQKPNWMETNSWIDCSILESLHQPFHGLCQSLVNNAQQWKEYFQHQISLVNSVPGSTLQELSLFQKCLLWKFVCPKKFSELVNAIILYELGNTIDSPDNYDIREVYRYTDKHTPTVFILPASEQNKLMNGTQGLVFANPVPEIKRLAREMDMEGKVCVLSFGVGSQMADVKQAIEDCMQAGHWLLLQNYHLAEEPNTSFFDLLKHIIYSRWSDDGNNQEQTEDTGRSLVTRSCYSSHSRPAAKLSNSFRLWITTKADGNRIMPGLLVQHGLRVTCELTVNFPSLLGKAYKSSAFLMSAKAASGEQLIQRFNRVIPLALIHAILVQQSYYGRHGFVNNHFWTIADVASAVEIFQSLSVWTNDIEAVPKLITNIYSDHCLDLRDTQIVASVVKNLLGVKHSANGNQGAAMLLNKLSNNIKETNDLQKTLDTIDSNSAQTYCLPEENEEMHIALKSKIFFKEMVQVTGAPELLLSYATSANLLNGVSKDVLDSLQAHLEACPMLPDISVDQIMPMDEFFAQEIKMYKNLINTIKNDMQTLAKAVVGKITLTPDMVNILDAISADQVPAAWLKNTFVTCKSLDAWLAMLPAKSMYVLQCYNRCPDVLSLNMLMRPDRVFHVVTQSYASKYFKDLTDVSLELQVMPYDFKTEAKPSVGLYVNGLVLKNAFWDKRTCVLSEATSCEGGVHQFPLVWLKPISTVSRETATNKDLYMCPICSSSDPEHIKDSLLLFCIPLPTKTSPLLCAQRRVSLALVQHVL